MAAGSHLAGATTIADPELVERVVQAVVASFPFAFCFNCLATRLGLSENLVRDATQSVISREDFRVERRSCYGCNRIETVLIGERH
jgi:hypothetical protein